MQPASDAASAETATAAATARECLRRAGGRDEAAGVTDGDGDGVGVRGEWQGLGRTAGPPDPERRDSGTDSLPNSRSPPEDTHRARRIVPSAAARAGPCRAGRAGPGQAVPGQGPTRPY
ncbi:hypothetical protein RM550_23890 [Streptomyces sp. DSM 41527]|uniref:Uncharacterized protein n=1 Tax=Streptomyces mooreae TaxID=3075523 RepID=A0ABU2TCT9_9ACTN|nr:hypothetical protein [Streptomyces sp. DSM 41527]MDT0458730.1 hypothetical protein [Streptomyces sp. DSM 41527]